VYAFIILKLVAPERYTTNLYVIVVVVEIVLAVNVNV
jgi:hypothetical protein